MKKQQGVGEGRTEQQPDHQGEHGDGQHHRHEDPGHPVGQPLNRRFASLRLLDQPDDLRQHGIVPHAHGAKMESAGAVERGAGHRIARAF